MTTGFPYRLDATGRTAGPRDADEHARQLIEQVLLTAPGERVMRPDFGTGVHQMVFSPSDDQAAAATQQMLSGALQQWLASSVTATAVEVVGGTETLDITIRYIVARTGERGTTTVTVGR